MCRIRIYLLFLSFVFFFSCANNSSLRSYPKNSYIPPFYYQKIDAVKYFDGPRRSLHNHKVFVTKEFFAKEEYETITEITIKTNWPPWLPSWAYERILNELADEARVWGADAVIEVNLWLSWRSSYCGKGKVVIINSAGDDRISIIDGQYR